jgi:hypothetical protein
VDDETFQRMVERQYELLRKERTKDCSDDDKSRPSDDSSQQQQPTHAEPVVTTADDPQPPIEVICVLCFVCYKICKFKSWTLPYSTKLCILLQQKQRSKKVLSLSLCPTQISSQKM